MPVAVETNFLLALADSDDDAWDAVETLRRKADRLPLIASPTVISEVTFFTRFAAAVPVTSDTDLRGVDFARLTFELRHFDLNAPVIATPKEIVQKFFR